MARSSSLHLQVSAPFRNTRRVLKTHATSATMKADNMNTGDKPWFLKSKHPVDLPICEALTFPEDKLDAYLTDLTQSTLLRQFQEEYVTPANEPAGSLADAVDDDNTDTFTLVSEQPSTTADIRQKMEDVNMGGEKDMEMSSSEDEAASESSDDGAEPFDSKAAFVTGLTSYLAAHKKSQPTQSDAKTTENKMLTENGDLANRSTNDPLLDLFTELEDVVSGPRLLELLNGAWNKDPLLTIKIIFNARSIHLGKAARHTFYRCAGWLAQHHPRTLAANLQWLSRPVIEKKVAKKVDGEEDLVVIEPETTDEAAKFDVRFGVAHGYWKDLLNLLALSVTGNLNPLSDPKDILNVEEENSTRFGKREDKTQVTLARHANALSHFTTDPTYHTLHLTVARLFADQLKTDLAILRGNDEKKKAEISLCSKWAPSLDRFHDKHTYIATSIAEIMFPVSRFPPLVIGESRDLYLRHAREEYRRTLSALRAHLDVAERKITAGTFSEIKYEKVPSLAMKAYAGLFAKKDEDRFTEYLSNVSSGKATISGAVLLPSVLVKQAREAVFGTRGQERSFGTGRSRKRGTRGRGGRGGRQIVISKPAAQIELEDQVMDGQWKTLVQRIRDSGSLESCIAVCDVSGSMASPTFADSTTPMDSAIGLSLLMAEVVAPPFGGLFITFSQQPKVEQIQLKLSLREKVKNMEESSWGYNTNFVAVFEDLILPMAVEKKLTQEQMVKRVFVFSDMQFDEAGGNSGYNRSEATAKWESSFERIQRKYVEAGYEMPELVFWNLAGGRAGVTGYGDPTAPKPVTAEQPGVAMVSGYSQGMLKVFMDGGLYEEEAEEVVTEEAEDGAVEVATKKRRLNPVDLMMKALGHKAYGMLKVVD